MASPMDRNLAQERQEAIDLARQKSFDVAEPTWNVPGTIRPPLQHVYYPTEKWKSNLPPDLRAYFDYEIRQGLHEKEGYTEHVPLEWGYAWNRQYNKPEESYFADDPKRLAKFHLFGENAPYDWEPPYWYDRNKIGEAYDYMSELYGKDWTQWEALDPLDPTSIYLATLQNPPNDFRLEHEIAEKPNNLVSLLSSIPVDSETGLIDVRSLSSDQLDFVFDQMYGPDDQLTEEQKQEKVLARAISQLPEGITDVSQLEDDEYEKFMQIIYGDEYDELSPFMQVGTWDEMETWQKLAMMLITPQPMEGRGWLNQNIAYAIHAFKGFRSGQALASMGVALAGMAIGAAGGTAITPGIGTAIGVVAGLGVGGAMVYQASTGKEVPIVSQILKLGNLPDDTTEKLIGLAYQSAGGDAQDVFANLPQAWKAGELTYDVGPVGVWMLNQMSSNFYHTQNFLNNSFGMNVEWSTGKHADWGAGEVWALERGLAEPIAMHNGMLVGEALDQARARLISGEDPLDVYNEYVSRYGFSGNLSDFIINSVVDIPGFAGVATNRLSAIIAEKTGNPRLAFVADTTRGRLALDLLPFPLKQVGQAVETMAARKFGFEALGTTGGLFDQMRIYKDVIRSGTLPLSYMGTETETYAQSLFQSHPETFEDAPAAFNRLYQYLSDVDEETGNKFFDEITFGKQFEEYINTRLKDIGIDVEDAHVKALIADAVEHQDEIFIRRSTVDETETGTGRIGDYEELTLKHPNEIYDFFKERILDNIIFGEGERVKTIIPPLTPWEKKFGGLTDAGEYQELQPHLNQTFVERLTQLTPESQAVLMNYLLTTNTGALLGEVGGSPGMRPTNMISMLRQIAEVDPVIAGMIGEQLINSPATKTTAPIIKAFVEAGLPDEMLAAWNTTQGSRNMLLELSEGLNQKPGELLDMISTDPKKVLSLALNIPESEQGLAIKNLAIAVQNGMTPEDLSKQFELFTTGKAHWHPDAFQADLMNNLSKFADKMLVDRYGISPKSWVFRLSDAMKSLMSLSVLGLNPTYAIYNLLDNQVTRASQGVFGYLTKSQIDTLWERMGMKPAQLEAGLGLRTLQTGEVVGGASVAAALDAGDWITKFKKAANKANALGIWSNVSGKIEVAESRQAVTIGTLMMLDRTWKPGLGYPKLPANIETELASIHPDLPQKLYGIVNSGLNIDEIASQLYKQGKLRSVDSLLEDSINDIFKNNTEGARDAVVRTGLKQHLEDAIKFAETTDDVDRVFGILKDNLKEMVETAMVTDIITGVEDVKARIQTEGLAAMLPDWARLWNLFTIRRLNDMVENQVTATKADTLKAKGFDELADVAWRTRLNESDAQWRTAKADMLSTAKTMFEVADLQNDNVVDYLTTMSKWMDTWDLFYLDKKKVWQRNQAGEISYKTAVQMINEMYNDHVKIEQDQIKLMFGSLGQLYQETSNHPASDVEAWGSNVLKSWDEATKAVSDFRNTLANTNMTPDEVRQAFQTFNTDTFAPLVKNQRNAMLDGAEALAGRGKAPELPPQMPEPEVPPVKTELPEAPPAKVELPDDVQRRVDDISQRADEAAKAQETYANALMTRNTFRDKLQKAFSLPSEEIKAVMTLTDAHAKVWAVRNNKTADDWYSDVFSDVVALSKAEVEEARAKGIDYAASVRFVEDGKRLLQVFEIPQGTNMYTVIHELGHIFRDALTPDEVDVLARWSGLESGEELTKYDNEIRSGYFDGRSASYKRWQKAEEAFADGFVRYLMEGRYQEVAPPKITNIFKSFGMWLKTAMESLWDPVKWRREVRKMELSDEMANVYNKLLFIEDDINFLADNKAKLQLMPKGVETYAMGVKLKETWRMQYRLVEMDDLVASHDIRFELNPRFPQELQARMRNLQTHQNYIRTIINEFNPGEMLIDTKFTDTGTPIIGPDMVVESGNGRVIVLQTMVDENNAGYEKYLEAIRNEFLNTYGFSEDALDNMKHPVLVRVRLDDVEDRIGFAEDANKDRKMGSAQIEVAKKAAEKLDVNVLSRVTIMNNFKGTAEADANLELILNYLKANPDHASLITGEADLNSLGVRALRNAVLYYAFGGSRSGESLLANMMDVETIPLNIVSGLENGSVRLAWLEGRIREGGYNEKYAFAGDLADAILAYQQIKRTKLSMSDFGAQMSSIHGEDNYSAIGLYKMSDTDAIKKYKINLLHYIDANAGKPSAITALIESYVNKMASSETSDQSFLFGGLSEEKEVMATNAMRELVAKGTSRPFGDYQVNLGLGLFSTITDPSKQGNAFGEVPLYGTPAPRYEGKMQEETYYELLKPLLDQMHKNALDDMDGGYSFEEADVPPELRMEIDSWLHNPVRESLASTKLNAMNFGQSMRERAMLNYQERYGLDDYLNIVFPYQFWYTRTMGEWAKRAIEKPEWIASLARIQKAQDKMRQYGIPSRLKGKVRIPFAGKEDWMGSGLYIDPLQNIFPFQEFLTPFEQSERIGSDVERQAIEILGSYVKEGRVTATQAKDAMGNMESPLWQEALAEAQNMKQGDLSANNLVNMMMSVAPWWSYPYHIMSGTADKLYPLPGTRWGQSMKATGLPLFKQLGQILSFPEEQIRKKFNLSNFGEYGDYYIDRHLSNMAGEGLIGWKEAVLAMTERQGPAYEEALRRTELEWALKMPGSQTALAVSEGRFGGIGYTLPTTLFPAGLLPEGELIQRGLKEEHSKAWADYKDGNPKAINEFFEKHPEYQARLALFAEPEDRLRQFLINEIWEKWFELEGKNKPLVVEQLGSQFENWFLDSDTKDYTAIDTESLVYWARLLGGMTPKADQEVPMYQQQSLKQYTPEVLAQVEAFEKQRNQKYPNYREQQTAYFELPESPKELRKKYLENHPKLKEYWDWKDEFYKKYPMVKMYQDDVSSRINDPEQIYTTYAGEQPEMVEVEDVRIEKAAESIKKDYPALTMQLVFSYYSGGDVSGAAREQLRNLWGKAGSPGVFEEWVYEIMRQLVP